MSSEEQNRKIKKYVSGWDQFKMAFTPGDTSVKEQQLRDLADSNERAELEAIRRKRLNAQK